METELIELQRVGDYCLEARLQDERLQDERQEAEPKADDRSTFRKITDVYFKPKFFEKGGKIYKYLGVKSVQKAVMGTVGRLVRKISDGDPDFFYLIGQKRDSESLKRYEVGTRVAELIHAPQIIWSINSLSKALSEEDYGSAIVSGAYLLINSSCTMLQRYNRARIYDVLEKRERRGSQ